LKTAVISDIHANATALEAVLEDISANGVDRIISLGDNIGYGPEPEKVISLLRANNIPSVIGNHEIGALRPEFLSLFNPVARQSIEMTVGMLSEDSLHYMRNLKTVIVDGELRFVHGFPPESPNKYLFEVSPYEIHTTLVESNERICFIGHTHDMEILVLENSRLIRRPLVKGIYPMVPENKYIINAGSVGQPRDGNSQSKYVVWDDEARQLFVRYVTYNISETVKKIYDAGLPLQHALRLI